MEVRSAASPDFHIRFDVPAAIGRFRSFQHRHLRNCLVVGGGISGSTLAHNLRRNHGLDVLLCESQDYLGGNVASAIITDDGGTFVYERGPNSFATTASIVRISHELGIQDDLVFADESLPPWVNHGGKIHPLPKGNGGKGPRGQLELLLGPNGIAKFAIAGDLLSWPGKVRAGVGAFLGHPPPPPDGREETIKEWVIRILGDKVFYCIIDPFVSGVYAVDPETLSMMSALPKISRIEKKSYNIPWNLFGALFYGGLARQAELARERRAPPPQTGMGRVRVRQPGELPGGTVKAPERDRGRARWERGEAPVDAHGTGPRGGRGGELRRDVRRAGGGREKEGRVAIRRQHDPRPRDR